MRARAWRLAFAVVVALTGLSRARDASAHLMPAGHGTLNVVGDGVFAVLSVPVSALHGFDDDGDGLLGVSELERHGEALRAEVDRRFVLLDGDTPGHTERVDLFLSPEHEASPDRAGEVVLLKHARFGRAVADLRVTCDLFDASAPLAITATRHPASGAEIEAAELTRGAPEHRFFQAATARVLDRLEAHARRGGGALTLLFGLAIVALVAAVARAGTRRRASVIGQLR